MFMRLTAADLSEHLVQVALGDREAFRQLYGATHCKLFGIVLRILRRQELAEEVLQEVYVAIWTRACDFTPGRASPISWMAAIARNRALDEVRRRRPEFTDADEKLEDASDPAASPADQAEINADLRRLESCMGGLDASRRDAIRLAYLDGLSRQELADRFQQPVGTIKTWLHRSLKQLKDCLGG